MYSLHILFSQQKSIAPMVHRQQTVDSLKKFNARRKLKVCRVPDNKIQ